MEYGVCSVSNYILKAAGSAAEPPWSTRYVAYRIIILKQLAVTATLPWSTWYVANRIIILKQLAVQQSRHGVLGM